MLSLWKDGPAERIEIGVLDGAAIEDLLVSALGGPVDAATVRELVARSQGNPMYFRELVNGALDTAALIDAGGLWRLQGALAPTTRLVELVALRLGDLSQSERSVLELLALGEPLEPAELTKLADPDSVDALENKGLITSRSEGTRIEIRLAHPVYGDVVRVGISARRERAIARSLADVIEAARGDHPGDSLFVASLRLVGGGASVDLLVSGAMAARARYDHSLTERLARAAIDQGAGFEARFVAAEAAFSQSRFDQAELELGDLGAQASNDAERARVALLRFHNVFLRREDGLRIIDDALDGIIDPFWRNELQNRRLFATEIFSTPRETLAATSTRTYRPGSGPQNVALGAMPYALVRMGRFEEAIDLLSPSPGTSAIPATGDPWYEWVLFAIRVAALIYAGRLEEADDFLNTAHSQVIESPAAEARALITRWFAILHLEQGRPMSAFRRASESHTLYQQLGQMRSCPTGLCRRRPRFGHGRKGRPSGRDARGDRCSRRSVSSHH